MVVAPPTAHQTPATVAETVAEGMWSVLDKAAYHICGAVPISSSASTSTTASVRWTAAPVTTVLKQRPQCCRSHQGTQLICRSMHSSAILGSAAQRSCSMLLWASCRVTTYASMAGGANPRHTTFGCHLTTKSWFGTRAM